MTAAEFTYWMAMHELQPFGEDWQDFRGALQAAQIVAPHVRNGVKIADFMPHRKPARQQSPAEQLEALRLGMMGA